MFLKLVKVLNQAISIHFYGKDIRQIHKEFKKCQ